MAHFATDFVLVALLWIVCSTTGAAEDIAPDIEAGRQLFAPCAVCHGAAGEGNRAVHAPKLAGREDWYLERQLRHFRSGVRGAAADDVHGQQMANAALVLWDEHEVRNVVAFVATLPSQNPARTLRGKASRGEKLYAGCAGCHGPQAEGSPETSAPRLAGLDDWYIVNQLRLFRSGLRGAHNEDSYGQQMKPITDTLPDEEALLDVAAYINTLN